MSSLQVLIVLITALSGLDGHLHGHLHGCLQVAGIDLLAMADMGVQLNLTLHAITQINCEGKIIVSTVSLAHSVSLQ